MSDPKTCKECGCELEDDDEIYCDDCAWEDDEFEDDDENS